MKKGKFLKLTAIKFMMDADYVRNLRHAISSYRNDLVLSIRNQEYLKTQVIIQDITDDIKNAFRGMRVNSLGVYAYALYARFMALERLLPNGSERMIHKTIDDIEDRIEILELGINSPIQ